ncbi:Exostosin family protein [Thiorhodovibrio winogradskyi]|uniref:Exostosin family protein n=1 Tax=Thiorhodovibrio winogradskyi TaxID=77007 RepID=A0ABZ0SDN6_9GAMM|nr:exostosin family protein [Thiorhodovibrio winogradskyi]
MTRLPITLWTPYYAAATEERQAELDECLRINLACDAIRHVVLLIDDDHQPPVQHDKIRIVTTNDRPTYRLWLEDAARSATTGIALLANSDIYFDETLSLLEQVFESEQASGPVFVGLSRFDRVAGELKPHPNPQWSQDTWALRLPARLPTPLLKSLEIPLGVPRCDNKVGYLFALHGWTLINPFPHLHGIHVHETEQRSYSKRTDDRVMGAVAYVYPGAELTDPARLDIDIWKRGQHQIGNITINNRLDTWQNEALGEPKSISPRQERQPSTSRPIQQMTSRQHVPGIRSDLVNHASINEVQRLLQTGERVFHQGSRFLIKRAGSRVLCLDRLAINNARILDLQGPVINESGHLALELMAAFVPPILDATPIQVADRPRFPGDIQFWQYPAATERQACENHRKIPPGQNLDQKTACIHCYLPLPWASYNDIGSFPESALSVIEVRLRGLRAFCAQQGYRLRVHTVCQTIHWRRLLERFEALGITDLHVAHCVKDEAPSLATPALRIHSWPLMAVNLEAPGRSEGLIIGKPPAEKRYLASFIGAHMSHYPSDLRLRLAEVARKETKDDVLVEVSEKWHFNDTVFIEQVKSKALTQEVTSAQNASMRRYNAILSDSVFSLCPAGAGPNTLRVWESLGVGAIPVIIADQWQPPTTSSGTAGLADCCLFIKESALDSLFTQLRALDASRVEQMSRACLDVYARFRDKLAFRPFD